MAEEVRVKKSTAYLLAGLLILGAFVAVFWEDIQEWFGTLEQPTVQEKTPTQTIKEETETTTEEPEEEPMPSYQISTVNLYLMNALDTDSGISGETIYVYEMTADPTDPDTRSVDSDTTDANGLASFTSGAIFVGKKYQYVLKGSNVYDERLVLEVPVPSREFKIDSYTFPDPMYAYYVGSFGTLGSDLTINITSDTGINVYSFDINITQTQAGKVAKDPVLVLRTPEGKDLSTGCIRSIYFIHKSGTNLGLPAGDVSDYIDKKVIKLNGVMPGFLTANDQETVTVKIETDNSLCTAGTGFEIVLDDLGGYRARDTYSLKLGATAVDVDINFVS